MRLGFLGLGNMGRAMARALMRAGHEVAVWDRTPAMAEGLVSDGARAATSPADAARGADVVLSSLSEDHAVSQEVHPATERVEEGRAAVQVPVLTRGEHHELTTLRDIGAAEHRRRDVVLPCGTVRLVELPRHGRANRAE